VTKITSVTIITLVTPKTGAKHELLFNKRPQQSINFKCLWCVVQSLCITDVHWTAIKKCMTLQERICIVSKTVRQLYFDSKFVQEKEDNNSATKLITNSVTLIFRKKSHNFEKKGLIWVSLRPFLSFNVECSSVGSSLARRCCNRAESAWPWRTL